MGKLYQNKWAGYETYFTPTHPVRTRKKESDAVGGYEITKIDGKWECRKGQYYTHSLCDEEHFPVVGNVKINILGYVMGEMLDALDLLKNTPTAYPDYKTDHGYMWLCPECGLQVHSDFVKCPRCGLVRHDTQKEK